MKQKEYKCNPTCPYFSNPENPLWKWNEEHTYKVPINPFNFICRYDGHIIKNWYDDCPKQNEENL